MAGSQERQRDHKRSRPGGEHPSAFPRTTEAPERSNQQPVPAVEDDRRKRGRDHRQRVSLQTSGRRQRGRACVYEPSPFGITRQLTESLDCTPHVPFAHRRAVSLEKSCSRFRVRQPGYAVSRSVTLS
jgi:hypothetical protein